MPNRTTPGVFSSFSRLIDRWQREQRTMSKFDAVPGAELPAVPEGWTWTEGELMLLGVCMWFFSFFFLYRSVEYFVRG